MAEADGRGTWGRVMGNPMFNNEWGPQPGVNPGGTSAYAGDPNEMMRRLAEMLKRFGSAAGQVNIPMGSIDQMSQKPPVGGGRP